MPAISARSVFTTLLRPDTYDDGSVGEPEQERSKIPQGGNTGRD
jgi:hypothetical protein